ncbi:MAG: tRNA (adenosine(37)-N6)-threonylcarbamoyltransferase complex dimerization subunit type 1 TsaB [Dehalococcoidales bacterium]|jgi:tRNA threonylcarbamoyladenosine biosynthesis protein TsaB
MIILGIDTSGYVNAVGIADSNRVLADVTFPARTDTLEQIVDNIDVTLKSAGLALKDVGGIGVGLGPGSWTGIKVGVTVGKMLAFSTGKPVAGIPTLEALAYGLKGEAQNILAVISAGIKDTVYAARYHIKGNEILREGEYFTGPVNSLAAMIKEPTVLEGSGIGHYVDIIIEADESLKPKIKAAEAAPSGAMVACLAAGRLEKGKSDDTLSLTPLYLKESTAKAFVNKYSQKPS